MAGAAEPGEPDCPVCREGRLATRTGTIAFIQRTDRGEISVHIEIPLSVCERCGVRMWSDAEEKVIDDAVRREYEKLPKP
jgi:YgiT-type zinc finger domain-containing protein